MKFLHPIEDTKSQNPYFIWRQILVWIKERVSFLPGAGPLEKLEKQKVRDLFRFLRKQNLDIVVCSFPKRSRVVISTKSTKLKKEQLNIKI